MTYDDSYVASYGDRPSHIRLVRNQRGTWHAFSDNPVGRGHGDSSFEALGDLLEKLADERAAHTVKSPA